MNNLDDIINGFIAFLKSVNQLQSLPEIVKKLNQRLVSNQNTAYVVSAVVLNEEDKEQIKMFLKRKLNRDFFIEIEIDKTIIGGLKIRVRDQIIDMTLNGRMSSLIDQLSS